VTLLAMIAGMMRSGADVTPNAINWTNATGGLGVADTGSQTVLGINTGITLRATLSSVSITGGGSCTLVARVNGANQTPVTVSNGATVDMTGVVASDLTLWRSQASGGASGTITYTATVTNVTDGGAAIDTFTVSHSW
jgi:hypothetical protein